MDFIPFLPMTEADAVLDQHYQNEQCRGEMEAELGSDLFYSGFSSWEATSEARRQMDEAGAKYDRSPEGQRFAARLEAAQFMTSVTHGFDVVSMEEHTDHRIFTPVGAPIIPEFWPDGPSRSLFGPSSPNTDNIPF